MEIGVVPSERSSVLQIYYVAPGATLSQCLVWDRMNALIALLPLDRTGGCVTMVHTTRRILRPRAITLGADKAYDAEDFVNELRSMTVTPHVAQNTSGRSSAIDARTTRHGGYAGSQRVRKRIEEAFGWIKTVARQEKTKFRGRGRVGWAFTFAAAAYNLVRLPKLIAEKG
jgi:hypothetical protein